MKIPRNISSEDLIKSLQNLGYIPTRQKGSHIRLTNSIENQYHITIPNHKPVKIGTLNSIIREVSNQTKIDKNALIELLFKD